MRLSEGLIFGNVYLFSTFTIYPAVQIEAACMRSWLEKSKRIQAGLYPFNSMTCTADKAMATIKLMIFIGPYIC